MSVLNLRSLAEDDDNYIEGVYNYCNRWCERCPFTARCLNYAIGQEQFPDEESRDLNNEAFWQGLHDVFAQTKALLVQMAQERGVDLEALDTPESRAVWQAREAELEKQIESSPLHSAAEAYRQMVDGWFKESEDDFRAKGDELTMLTRLGVAGLDPEAIAISLADAVEVIRWYQLFIGVKLMRAISGAIDEEDDDPEMLAEFGRDSDGSAKIALIAIDHSIGAWGVLLAAFSDRETETLTILAHLDRLRRATEREFPRARAFVRAGWDTGEAA
ncbi:MAG: hypothetical protein DWI57_14430 [Chloroflexi bacterium]|nr:MAG: hypothetical protein DWI57_14430 [Chloroflexota bacterium]